MTSEDVAPERSARRGPGSPRGMCGVDRLLRPALELALDVARGGLDADPPVPPPSGLRKVLTFARPSGAAWATVLRVVEADDEFRARVAEAADPDVVGRGPWLWLTRPEGWRPRSSASPSIPNRSRPRTTPARSTRCAAGSPVPSRPPGARASAAARAEADDLHTRLAEQRPRLDELEQRVGRLSGDLEAATTERRDAIRNLKAAEADLVESRNRLRDEEQVRRGAEAAVVELRRVVDEADRASVEVPAPPPEVPEPPTAPGPDLDVLSAAVREAGAAAAALGRALDAAAGALPPADAVPTGGAGPTRRCPGAEQSEQPSRSDPTSGSPTGPPPGWRVRGVGGGSRPPAAPPRRHRRGRRLQLAKTAWTDVSLEEERRRLVQLLERVHLHTKRTSSWCSTVSAPPACRLVRLGARTVRFSPAGVSADDVVRNLVDELPLGRPVVVVSSDREVVDGARARGANVIGSGQLLDAVR